MSTLATWTSDASCSYHGHSIRFRLGLTHDCYLLFEPSDFSLVRGTITGLIGTNGAGKTSLAKVLVSKELPGFPVDLAIQYISSHENYAFQEEEQLPFDYMQSVVQEKLAKLTSEIQELEEAEEGDVQETANRLAELYERQEELEMSSEREIQQTLAELGFEPHLLEKPLAQLSCGWRYKCRLAAALTSHPDLLLIDEPSFLDDTSTAWLVRKVKEAATTGNAMVVIISHKETLLQQLCDRILYINSANHTLSLHNQNYQVFRSTLQEQTANAARVCQDFDDKLQTAEKSLKSIQDQLSRREKNMKKQTTHNADRRFIKGKNKEAKQKADRSSAAKLKQLKHDASNVEELRRQAQRELVKPLKIAGMAAHDGTTLALFQQVTFAYEGGEGRQVLCNLDARIEAHDRILLCGANGSGKSTFLKLVVGDLEPTGGSLTRNAHALYFPQTALTELTRQHQNETPADYLGAGDHLTQTEARQHLGDFGLASTALRPIVSLSAGQRVRLWLAKKQLEMGTPSLLILDEVTENLDIETKRSLLEVINTFVGAVIVVSHDEDSCIALKPTRTWKLINGTMHEQHTEIPSHKKST